MTKNNPIAG